MDACLRVALGAACKDGVAQENPAAKPRSAIARRTEPSAARSRHYTHIDEGAKRKALAKLPDVTSALLEKKPKG